MTREEYKKAVLELSHSGPQAAGSLIYNLESSSTLIVTPPTPTLTLSTTSGIIYTGALTTSTATATWPWTQGTLTFEEVAGLYPAPEPEPEPRPEPVHGWDEDEGPFELVVEQRTTEPPYPGIWEIAQDYASDAYRVTLNDLARQQIMVPYSAFRTLYTGDRSEIRRVLESLVERHWRDQHPRVTTEHYVLLPRAA
jgi:hypothetical protein